MKTVTIVVAVVNNEDLNQVRDYLASIDTVLDKALKILN